MATVHLEGLGKTYPGGIVAVQGVDLDVAVSVAVIAETLTAKEICG